MRPKPLTTIGFMVAIAAVFGAGVTGIHLASLGRLERNTAYLEEKAIVEVFGLGDATSLPAERVAALADQVSDDEVCRDPETGLEFRLLKAYGMNARGERHVTAYGFRFRGPGFWAPIEGILALEADKDDPRRAGDRTVGLTIIEQNETPGLGGRVAEAVFTEQFAGRGILISPVKAGGKTVTISSGSGDDDRHVDAITGATQTSMAMERMLNHYLECFHRAMAARQAQQ